jgi:hypothetical protein
MYIYIHTHTCIYVYITQRLRLMVQYMSTSRLISAVYVYIMSHGVMVVQYITGGIVYVYVMSVYHIYTLYIHIYTPCTHSHTHTPTRAGTRGGGEGGARGAGWEGEGGGSGGGGGAGRVGGGGFTSGSGRAREPTQNGMAMAAAQGWAANAAVDALGLDMVGIIFKMAYVHCKAAKTPTARARRIFQVHLLVNYITQQDQHHLGVCGDLNLTPDDYLRLQDSTRCDHVTFLPPRNANTGDTLSAVNTNR